MMGAANTERATTKMGTVEKLTMILDYWQADKSTKQNSVFVRRLYIFCLSMQILNAKIRRNDEGNEYP